MSIRKISMNEARSAIVLDKDDDEMEGVVIDAESVDDLWSLLEEVYKIDIPFWVRDAVENATIAEYQIAASLLAQLN
jgi:S-adenosylmethionine:tRNA-ribosyltransferase-isomerase (queuine synthetase)